MKLVVDNYLIQSQAESRLHRQGPVIPVHYVDADARQQCAHPERLGLTIQQQAAACRQAGVTP